MTLLSKPLTDGAYRMAAEAKCVVESWGSLNWLVSQELTHTPNPTLGRVVIKTGMPNPKHSHPNSVEVLYMLRGTLRHVIGDDTVRMQAGDTTVVPAGVLHDSPDRLR